MPSTQTSRVGTQPLLAAPSGQLVFGFAALILAALAMSTSPTFVRLSDVGPLASAFWRVLLALPILYVWMRMAETGPERRAASRFALPTVLAGLSFAGDLFFWHLASRHTTVANATFFGTMAPLWVVIFGWLLFRKKPRPAMIAGLALCIAGGSALVAQSLAFSPERFQGDVFGMITAVFFGLYFLSVEAARGRAGAARVTFEMSLVAVVVLAFVAFAYEPRMLPESLSGWLTLAGLAFVSQAGGQGLLSVALGRLPASFSSLVIFIEVISAALFAWLVLGEPVTSVQVLGGVAILLGIWVARPRRAVAL